MNYIYMSVRRPYVGIFILQQRECVASKMILVYHEKSESNLADLLTTVLPVEQQVNLLKGIMN